MRLALSAAVRREATREITSVERSKRQRILDHTFLRRGYNAEGGIKDP